MRRIRHITNSLPLGAQVVLMAVIAGAMTGGLTLIATLDFARGLLAFGLATVGTGIIFGYYYFKNRHRV